jgi:LuxR family transcriptional regulator, maltose regulon positive regulatory protein
MGDTDTRRPAGQVYRGGPAFDLVVSKLRHPVVRPGTIRRPSLIERLARDDSGPIVSVVAPAGYGKTTLLSQWAERNGRAFAWVSVDEADNDPKVLLSYVAEALNAVEPVGRRVFETLASRTSSVPGSVVPRLGAAFSAMTVPVVLALDDVHLLHNSECRAALSVLADHVPGGSRLAFAGRSQPPLRVARLRAAGKILEIGRGDLALSREEAASLLRNAQVSLGGDEVAELHRRTEGWPVGLYLAALFLREGGSLGNAAISFEGDHRFVSDYVESELLARIPPRHRMFLTRTAVLERMCGPLCDQVLDVTGSAAALDDLARSNMLLVPLDQRGQWYRYHHLFRDMLLAELERLEPELIPVLRRRAAAWYLRNSQAEAALEYHIAAGDVTEAAQLVAQLWLLAGRQGRLATIQRWFEWLDERGGIGGYPMLAAQAALVTAEIGRPTEAERWADVVDRWQYQDAAQPEDSDAETWACVLRAVLCRHGVEQMRTDADEAARRFTAENIVMPVALLMQGLARVLCGDLDGGDLILEDAARAKEKDIMPDVLAFVTCERSLVAMTRGKWSEAEALAGQAGTALRRGGIEDSYAVPLVCAARARIALRRGDVTVAREQLVHAQRLRHLLTYAIPHVAVQARVELIRVHAALGDLSGAQTLMQEIDEILKRRPGLGILVDEAEVLRTQLAKEHGSSIPGASAMTAAELRLLPMLCTHLSVSEIAAELFLSPHTIKSQMKSIYRKLGASTRNEAVTRSRDLGLLDG